VTPGYPYPVFGDFMPSGPELGEQMGKVLVLYHSASGNTAAMARLVAEGAGLIPGTDVRLREVDAATPGDVYWCDGLGNDFLVGENRIEQ
jgi:hypothetical protein